MERGVGFVNRAQSRKRCAFRKAASVLERGTSFVNRAQSGKRHAFRKAMPLLKRNTSFVKQAPSSVFRKAFFVKQCFF